jgi:hypothetical protein
MYICACEHVQVKRTATSRKLKMASLLKQYVVKIAQASCSSLYPASCQVKCAMRPAQAFIKVYICTNCLTCEHVHVV